MCGTKKILERKVVIFKGLHGTSWFSSCLILVPLPTFPFKSRFVGKMNVSKPRRFSSYVSLDILNKLSRIDLKKAQQRSQTYGIGTQPVSTLIPDQSTHKIPGVFRGVG